MFWGETLKVNSFFSHKITHVVYVKFFYVSSISTGRVDLINKRYTIINYNKLVQW